MKIAINNSNLPQIDLAIIIINNNNTSNLKSKIDSLINVNYLYEIEIIIVNISDNLIHLDYDKISIINNKDINYDNYLIAYRIGYEYLKNKFISKYIWFMTDKISMKESALETLIKIGDKYNDIAILYPKLETSKSLKGRGRSENVYINVISYACNSFLLRSKIVTELGFYNKFFNYNVGALEEYAYKIYKNNYRVVLCENVLATQDSFNKSFNDKSINERKSKEIAARYFVEHYGKNWDNIFMAGVNLEIAGDDFHSLRRDWESVLDLSEKKNYQYKIFNSKNDLKSQIKALNPWYYDLKIGNQKVSPGIGSKQKKRDLILRTRYRSKLLVDEVNKKYNFSNKRILDIGSNCGYWSARYAEKGASSMLGIEGRSIFLNQGLLYWQNNKFMEPNNYKFIKGNISDKTVWKKIEEYKMFHFTICAGILYHVPNYEEIIQFIISITNEAVLIDTRVTDIDKYIVEPGGWQFDAIIETRKKRIPKLNVMMNLFEQAGFRLTKLTTNVSMPRCLKGKDDYMLGNRMALLAIRS